MEQYSVHMKNELPSDSDDARNTVAVAGAKRKEISRGRAPATATILKTAMGFVALNFLKTIVAFLGAHDRVHF